MQTEFNPESNLIKYYAFISDNAPVYVVGEYDDYEELRAHNIKNLHVIEATSYRDAQLLAFEMQSEMFPPALINNIDGVWTFIDVFGAAQANAHAIAKSKGWWDEPIREDGTAIALMHSELSELLEALRMPGKPAQFPGACGISNEEEELADLIIRAMDFAQHKGYSLGRAIAVKMAYNATRPHKHGGKKF